MTGGATIPMRCCTRMRSGDCTRCSGCNGKPVSMSTASSTAAAGDTVIEVVPRQGTLTRLRRRNPGAAFDPYRLRLVQYTVGDTVFILGTTLLDRDQYSIDQLSDLYHARWGHRGSVQGIQTADGG